MWDWENITTGAGAILTTTTAYVRGRRTARRRLNDELDDCLHRNHELRDRLSALETEMVTLRKLLPGGEWYRRLGLDKF